MNNPFYQFRRFEYMLDNFSTLFINHHWLILFSIFFVSFLLTFLVFRSLNHVIFLGMSEDDREASKNIELNGKRQKRNIFSAIQYDKPYFSLLLIRQFGIFAKLIMLFLVAIFFTFFVISLLSALFDIDYVFQPYNVQYYLLTSNNYYGVSAIILAALFSYLSAAIFYHKFIKSFFGDLDIEFNEDMIKKREKSSLRNDRLVDIRNYQFKKHEEYDPTLFFEDARQRGALFLGIDENNQPIFFPKKEWDETNVQVIGKMGSGKGVLSTVALVQCTQTYHDINIIFDPKNDEWAYHVFYAYSLPENFFYLDLNRGQPPQVNLFKDASSDEINELLVASFGLGEKGTDADFYKTGDRKVCRSLSQYFQSGATMRQLLTKAFDPEFRQSFDGKGENFFNLLEELGQLDSIGAENGIDLKSLIEDRQNITLFITGSLRDEVVVKAQKMLFLRIVQILEKRDRSKNVTHVNIMLDELKYLISKSALEAMGTLRDKKANIIFTHQSRGDLEVSTKEIDGQTARKVIEDSAGLRWIYRTDNFESAKWASDFTAGGLVDVERRNLSVNQSNVEMAAKEATIFKQKANYIDISVIQNLPSRCGLIVGDGQSARLAYSSPIRVKKIEKCVTIAENLALSSQDFLNNLLNIDCSTRDKKNAPKGKNNNQSRIPQPTNTVASGGGIDNSTLSFEEQQELSARLNEITANEQNKDHESH